MTVYSAVNWLLMKVGIVVLPCDVAEWEPDLVEKLKQLEVL